MSVSASRIVAAFHRAASVSREALYGLSEDAQLPQNLHADARLPFLGFCGPGYRKGGAVFLAINPGGGGDAYVARTQQDSALLPLIERFSDSPIEAAGAPFERMCESYLAQAQSWNLWRILGPAIAACNARAEDLCYLNCFPYRTRGDALPSAQPLRLSWQKVVSPLITELEPSLLVVLGKKAGNVVARLYDGDAPAFVVPRTIGDSHVSPAASESLVDLEHLSALAVRADRGEADGAGPLGSAHQLLESLGAVGYFGVRVVELEALGGPNDRAPDLVKGRAGGPPHKSGRCSSADD